MAQRVVESQEDGVAPFPGVVTAAAHQSGDLLYTFLETLHQGICEGRIAGRKPARPVVR